MRWLLLFVLFCSLTSAWSQTDAIARRYLKDGDFEKAAVYYEQLVKTHPTRPDYLQQLVTCYQQLEQYSKIEQLLVPKINSGSIYPPLIIDMGYTYKLQNQNTKATQYFNKALNAVKQQPLYADAVGLQFQKYALLDYAIQAYTIGAERNPKANYNFQLARIYGEKGDIEKMYDNYLQVITFNTASKSNVLYYISQFITENPEHKNNILLKRALLKKAQKEPNILWNELLSWLFVQQHQYMSAFIQEKAIYNRATEGTSLQRIERLANLAQKHNDTEAAKAINNYIVENAVAIKTKINAHLQLINLKLKQPNKKTIQEVESTYQNLLNQYGKTPETLNLQNAYASFLAFKKEQPNLAISFLKESMGLPLTRFEQAELKMTLADILVYAERFNEALIYYSQIQKSLKNHVIGQNARFKVAQTSFYKGDFDWANTQLKVLRSSASQLIANDAMQLSLLITDNILEDSTQTALKKYAKAHLYAYQNKKQEAIAFLDDILKNHKGESIEDEALFKQAQLLTTLGLYDKALVNYLKIIEFHGYGILADDALYELAKLYLNAFNEPEKAMPYLEKIIFNHPDSIHFVEARKKYRALRGDAIN